jgi:hypothetical protein
MVAIHFFLHNIPASDENPFKLLVNSDTAFESTTSIAAQQISHDVGTPTTQPHQVYVNVMINEKYIDELERYNLTKNGYYFSIGLDEADNFAVQQAEQSYGGDVVEGSEPVYQSSEPEPTQEPEPIVEETFQEQEPIVEDQHNDVPPQLNEEEERAYEKLLNFRDKGYLTDEEFNERIATLYNEARNRASNPEHEPEPEPEPHYEEQPYHQEYQVRFLRPNFSQICRINLKKRSI